MHSIQKAKFELMVRVHWQSFKAKNISDGDCDTPDNALVLTNLGIKT
jgi:hypothetical protein